MIKGSFIKSSEIIKNNNNKYEINCKKRDQSYILNKIMSNNNSYANIDGILKKEDGDTLNVIIPKKIFQTHKSLSYIRNNSRLLNAQNSWRKYREYEYHFYSDKKQDEFMKTHFADIYDAYQKCPLIVMKADLWRYCIIYKYGGIYADSDTICLERPDFLIKNSYLVGVPENNTHLCQWVFSAPKDSPIIKSIIDLSVKRIRETSKFTGEHFVHNYTGPAVFTDGIEKWLYDNHYTILKNKVDYSNYQNNVIYFYPTTFHNNKVKHLYSGSWKNGWKIERKKFLKK
jgi:mannosyltransferase OCH1-like enzyme